MRKPIVAFGLFVTAIALLAACSSAATPAPTPPAALPGTSWRLGAQGGTAPAARALPTLTFGTDGTVSGNTTCNNYTGMFTATGSSISIRAPAPASFPALTWPPCASTTARTIARPSPDEPVERSRAGSAW